MTQHWIKIHMKFDSANESVLSQPSHIRGYRRPMVHEFLQFPISPCQKPQLPHHRLLHILTERPQLFPADGSADIKIQQILHQAI